MKTEVLFLWILTTGILLVGYFGIVQPHEAEIQTHATSSTMLAERITRMEEILRNESALRTAHKRVVQELSQVLTNGHGTQDSAFVLRSIATEAQRAGLAILSISPGGSAPPQHSITSRDLLLSLRGCYRSIIAFLPRLSLTDPLLEIRTIAIHTQDQPGGKNLPALLRVDITARLYHIAPTALDGR